MLGYLFRRLLTIIPMTLVISFLVFVIVDLPPGDMVSLRVQTLQRQGMVVKAEEIARMKELYGVDQPLTVRYYKWIVNAVFKGNLGTSFEFQRPNADLLRETVPFSLVVTLAGLIISWAIAIPLGIYSATHKYSFIDYFLTLVGFFGLGAPGWLIAILGAWASITYLDFSPLGLVSPEFANQPWTWGKIVNMLAHLWFPIMLTGLTTTGSTIRVMRNNLLDQLKQQYVTTARAKGLSEFRILMKYPVRLALNPIISSIAFILPMAFAGEAIIAIVLGIPTVGPLLNIAVMQKDMQLAGTILLFYTLLVMLGTLVSDVLLAWVDPRVRFGGSVR